MQNKQQQKQPQSAFIQNQGSPNPNQQSPTNTKSVLLHSNNQLSTPPKTKRQLASVSNITPQQQRDLRFQMMNRKQQQQHRNPQQHQIQATSSGMYYV